MSADRPALAVYLSSHGYGHATRTAALLEHLCRSHPLDLHVVSSAPRWLWPAALDSMTRSWRAERCDVGVVETSDLSIDHRATRAALEAWAPLYDQRVEREARWLMGRAQLVLGDVPPLAFDAAARAGIEAVAMANFSWDWIYAELGFDEAARTARRAYGRAGLLLELEPAAPMTAFARRQAVGVLGRRPSGERAELRTRLALRDDERMVLVAFRSGMETLCRLPPPVAGLRYVVADEPPARADVIAAPSSMAFVDLLAAADAVVAKPGYGIIADSRTCGTPLLYTARRGFPEDEVLERWLARQPGVGRVERTALSSGGWLDELDALLAEGRIEPHGPAALESCAAVVLDSLHR